MKNGVKQTIYVSKVISMLGVIFLLWSCEDGEMHEIDWITTHFTNPNYYKMEIKYPEFYVTSIIEGPRNEHGRWHGRIKMEEKKGIDMGESLYFEEVDMVNGVRHGHSKRTYPDGTIHFLCYENGVSVECTKSASDIQEENSAFGLLSGQYPWFINKLDAFGFNSTYVNSYLDTLEVILYSTDFDEEDFEDKYDEAVYILEETPYDSIIEVNSFLSIFEGFEYAKNMEFRLAVLDHFFTEDSSTYTVVKKNYPNFLKILNEIPISEPDFKNFCHVFDSTMAVYGPLNQEDPFFTDSLDIRMYNVLNFMADSDDDTKSVVLKNGSNLFKSIRSLQKKIFNESINIQDNNPDMVANALISLALLEYTKGDLLKKSVKEIYQKRKSIITIPILSTVFGEMISNSSVIINGNVIDDGGANVTDRGIVWATYYNPTIENQLLTTGIGIGQYTINLSGLEQGTTYYARSYATNSTGTAYGNCVSFTAGVTGINKIQNPDFDFTVYPNPNQGRFTLKLDTKLEGSLTIKLVNMKGQIIEVRKVAPTVKNHIEQFDVSQLSKGVYHIIILSDKIQISEKIVVQ